MPEDVDYLLSVSRASAAADRQTDMDGRTPSHIILYRAASTAYGSAVKWARDPDHAIFGVWSFVIQRLVLDQAMYV